MKKVLFIFMLCISFAATSQEIDTTLVRLQEQLHSTPSDSIKVETLLELGKYQYGRDNYSAEDYLLKAIDFIENEAYSSDHQLAVAYRVLGAVERRKGNYKNTFANYYKALRLSSEPQHVATVHHNLGDAKLFQYEFPEAIAEFRKAISIWEDLNNYADAAGSYQAIGGVYRSIKQLDSARFYYEKALRLFAIGYKDDTLKYINKYYGIQKSLGMILLHKKKYDSALSKFKEARIHFSKPNHDKSRLIIVNGSISETYYRKGNYKEAIRYVNEALSISRSEGLKYRIASSLRRRSRFYKRMGKFDAALEDYVLYKKYSDSLINAETVRKIQAQELKYVFEKEKLADSIVFAQEKRKIEIVADNESSKKKIYFALLIITLILSTIIAFLVKRDFKYKKRVLELENKTLAAEKEQITNAFNKLKNSTNAEERIKAKQDILKLKILTDDDWLHFRDKFELLFPDFLTDLKDANFQFTKSEIRFLILKKLGLETKEIANMTGVSNDSVLKTQYRLRKKLSLDKNIDVIHFLEQSTEN